MLDMWIDCLIAGVMTFDGVKGSRRDEVKSELERRLAAGELTQEAYNNIFGIEPVNQSEDNEDSEED